MCFKPKVPKAEPLAIAAPNAGQAAAEAEAAVARHAGGFASTVKSTPASRSTGSTASKILFGQ